MSTFMYNNNCEDDRSGVIILPYFITMTKYSGEVKKDEEEPEEGEIQDDDDPMEDKLRAEESATFPKGKESEKCSNSCFLFRRDEPKSSQRKSDCSTFGVKSYYLPEETDDKFTSSQGSSRARFRTPGVNKWYYQYRQNNPSKDWSNWKPSGGAKERERKIRETKRTSRSQYYPSFFPSPCEPRSSTCAPLPSNAYLSPSIPTWHWYSKQVKEKNKKTSTLVKITDTIRQMTANNVSHSRNFNSYPSTMENFNKECHTKKEIEKQTESGPDSPTSTNSIEIIEVPPKIPEVITLYDTDEEEQCKESNISKSDFSNNEENACDDEETQKPSLENDANTSNYYENTHFQDDVSQENDVNKHNENMQYHLNALTLAMRNMFDERKKQELKTQQNSDALKLNLRITDSVDLSVHDESENNVVTSKFDACLAIPVLDNMQVNFSCEENMSMNNASTSQTDLDVDIEKSMKINQHDTLKDVIVSKPVSNDTEVSESGVHLTPIFSCSSALPLHSPCSISTPQAALQYMNETEISPIFVPNTLDKSLVKISSTNIMGELQNCKETNKSPGPSINEHANEPSIQNYASSNKDDNQVNNRDNSYNFQENYASKNSQCFHPENSDIISGDEYTKDVLDRSIYSRKSDLSTSETENANKKKCNDIYENDVDEAHNTDGIQGNSSIIERLCSLRGNEDCNASNLKILNKVCDKMISDKDLLKISDIHLHPENIVHIECTENVNTEKVDVLLQNTVPKINDSDSCSEIFKNKIGSEFLNPHGTLQDDCIDSPQLSFSASSNGTSNVLTSQSGKEGECDFLSNVKNGSEEVNCSQRTDNGENIIWKTCNVSESVGELKASTVAALKRRATELKKLKRCDSEIKASALLKKCENQGLIPTVIINKQLRETSVHVPSESYTPVYSSSLHVNNEKKKLKKLTTPTISQISSLGNSANSVGEKYFSYSTPALVYEDRIGSKNNEAGNVREQIAKRINVTVPEFIIKLGKESDSGDDSEDESTTKSSKDDEIKGQNSNLPSLQTINTDFEKKLDVLLKQARSQQELNSGDGKGSFIANEQLMLRSLQSNNTNNVLEKGYSLLQQKNMHPLNVNQGCARIIPRSTVKRMSCSRGGKTKVGGHRMKSVVIKNTPSNLHRARIIHNDRTSKHSTLVSLNNSKQAGKGWNRNVTNRAKVSHPTSSMADIRLLSPLKQKEYLKLKKQLVQMTQKKREKQTEEKSECTCYTNKDDNVDSAKVMQIPVRIASEGNNRQNKGHQLVTCDEGSNVILKTSQQNLEKVTEQDLHHSSEITSENTKNMQVSQNNKEHCYQECILQELVSVCHSCDEHTSDVNIIDSEDVFSHDVLPSIHCNHQEINIIESSIEPHATNLSDVSAFLQQKSSIEFEGQIRKTSINNGSPETTVCTSEKTLSGKRKLSALEQVQKKQKAGNRENMKHSMKIRDTATKATMCSLIQSKVAEDLWSSETKLIGRRRQVLEDIATIRLNLHKLDATNFRTGQIIKKICNLKEELKQAEGQLNQEKQLLKALNKRVDESKHSIQRGQSELLSLSLECEELGCKVHGPNYSVPNTSVELIRNEMLAMTEAMQEFEKHKNAM